VTSLNLVFILLIFSIGIALQMYFYRSFLLKILVITMLFSISSFAYFSLDGYKGWPTEEQIDEGYLIAVKVEEPSGTFQGAIYFWATPDKKEKTFLENLFSYNEEYSPRAYRLPYKESTASEFLSANEKIKQGFIVKIQGMRSPGTNQGKGKSQGEGLEGNGKSENEGQNGNLGDAEFYNVPSLKIVSPDEILRKQD
jgi:hypothetical protein